MCQPDLARSLLFSTIALLLVLTELKAGDEAAWNKELAAKYLDGRGQIWFESFPSAERGEGTSKTSCVSCHTLAPYALARPVLRKATGEKEPTKYEKQHLAATKKRVANWKDLDTPQFQLLYDFSERKKQESWGTEAILNSFVLAFDDAYQGRKEPSASTRTAFSNLWTTQATDGDERGSWDWLDFNLGPWEWKEGRYYGAALAAIAIGTAPGYKSGADREADNGVNLLRGYLRGNLARQNLHNRVWMLWAATTMGGLLDPEERKKIITEICDKQQQDGGWRLASLGEFKRNDGTPQDTTSDGYATGLVLHVLQIAGLSSSEPNVAKGLAWLRRNQKPSGAWAGSSVNKQRAPESTNHSKAHVGKFMWDAATAYAVLALSHSE